MVQAWRSPKDPDEIIDFQVDWSARLEEGETIVTSTWAITGSDSVLTEEDSEIDDESTVIWLSSGTLGVRYLLTNRITTSDGRTMDQSGYLKIRSK